MGWCRFSYDGGANWRKSERLPGLPDYGNYGVYVQRLYAGKSDENVVYGVWENTKNGDFKPYLYSSTNRGGSWESIAGDLPTNGPVLSFAEDHVNPNLLFVGTEFGLFFTVDGGKKWVRLRGNLPTIAVRDMVIQERENDLVLGDVRPRLLRPRRLHAAAARCRRRRSIATATSSRPRRRSSRRRKPAARAARRASRCGWRRIARSARSSPTGSRTRRSRRGSGARWRSRGEIKEGTQYPTQAQLTAETDEEAPQTFLTITDSANRVVRRLTVPGGRGIHRYVWNLRGIAPTTGGPGFGGGGGGGGNDDDDDAPAIQGGTGGGPYVAAGTYRVALSRRVNGVTTNLGEAQTHHGHRRSGGAATDARAAHGGDDVSGERREAAAHAHRRARAGEQHAHADAGDPPRPRRLTG